MSDSNRKRIAIAQETSFGAGPSPLDMYVLGVTGQSLRDRISYQESRTIRSDRNVQDIVRVGASAGGNLPFELTFPVANEALWLLLRGAMCSTESSAVTTAGVGLGDADFTITRGSGSFVSDGYQVGDVVKITGHANAANNVYKRLATVSALVMTVDSVDTAFINPGGTTCSVTRGARIKNGTTEYSFAAEVGSLDVGKYQLFRGQVVNTLDLQVSDQSILTGSFGLEGKTSTRGGSANGSSYTGTTNTSIMDAVSPPVVRVGALGTSYSTKSFSIGIRNNAAARTQVGALGPQSVRRGNFGVELSFQSYFQDFEEMDKFAGNTETTFWTVLTNGAGQGLAISIPAMKWMDLGADTTGVNADDYLTGRAMAKYDTTQDCTLRIQRFV